MTELTKEVEERIRRLTQALKQQMDFAATADMNKREHQLQRTQSNHTIASLMIDLVRDLDIAATGDTQVLDAIASAAGNDLGADLKAQVTKVRAINDRVRNLSIQRAVVRLLGEKLVKPDDLNRIFKECLSLS